MNSASLLFKLSMSPSPIRCCSYSWSFSFKHPFGDFFWGVGGFTFLEDSLWSLYCMPFAPSDRHHHLSSEFNFKQSNFVLFQGGQAQTPASPCGSLSYPILPYPFLPHFSSSPADPAWSPFFLRPLGLWVKEQNQRRWSLNGLKAKALTTSEMHSGSTIF